MIITIISIASIIIAAIFIYLFLLYYLTFENNELENA